MSTMIGSFLGWPHGQQSCHAFCFGSGSAPTFSLAYSHTSVANHTPIFFSDSRTRAFPLDLSRAHSELTTSLIEPGMAHWI